MTSPFLSKSRFILGTQCPSRIPFANRPGEYHDTRTENTFLKGLAEGGYQVGEYAKWMLCNDPAAASPLARGHEPAAQETRQRLTAGDAALCEPTFIHGNLLARADIVVKNGGTLHLYEVKSSSWAEDNDFWNKRDARQIKGDWKEYLMDVAFQVHVIRLSFPDLVVKPHLVLLDKARTTSVDRLNQLFPVVQRNGRMELDSKVKTRSDLGDDLLVYLPVDEEVSYLLASSHDLPDGRKGSFEDLVRQLADIHASGELTFSGVGAKCKGCPFKVPRDEAGSNLKSGVDECWAHACVNAGREYYPASSKVIDLWNFRGADKAIADGKLMLSDLSPGDIGSGARADRQLLQVEKEAQADDTPWLDLDGLRSAMNGWKFPLHFIDFETARQALPGFKGFVPYTQVAFQFSHHTVAADGTVTHAGQWIETAPGSFPSFAFVRALKSQLDKDGGTIFRYALHENTVLRDIASQLEVSQEADRAELIQWIGTITEAKLEGGRKEDKVRGPRNMVDMLEIVKSFHYDPRTRGSNSIKAVLPAIISRSAALRTKYGQPIGGSDIHSLNFGPEWIWISAASGSDPYAALPPVFDKSLDQELSDLVLSLDAVDDGGTATIAYAKLQFFSLPEAEREAIRTALLRYCELDTLAMVMLFQYWQEAVSTQA